MGTRRALQTDEAPAAIGPYSQAILDESTGFLFVAGQIGLDPRTGTLVEGGAPAECRQALENVRRILSSGSCSLDDVVRVTLYLADMADFSAVNAVYAEAFHPPFPARSTVAAAGLPRGARVEIEATALRTPGR